MAKAAKKAIKSTKLAKKKFSVKNVAAKKKKVTVAKIRPKKSSKPVKKVVSKTTKPQKGKGKKVAITKSGSKSAVRKNYPPSSTVYMDLAQREWFRQRLLDIRNNYLSNSAKTAQELRHQERDLADEIDRANSEFGYVIELRENERLGYLQNKIDSALIQMEKGSYGYCNECGEQIGIKRMVARPVASLCIDCKQFNERLEKKAP